jgi:calcium/calmodulin-dependent protein kinase (CaM kinase) II
VNASTWDQANLAARDREILVLNQTMLESVLNGDWETYARFCSQDLSCFEAETMGVLVEGLSFHRFYFSSTPPTSASTQGEQPKARVTMARPHLRWLSDDAVILSYTRLVQRCEAGAFSHTSCCETRVWQKLNSQWQQVHVHRS